MTCSFRSKPGMYQQKLPHQVTAISKCACHRPIYDATWSNEEQLHNTVLGQTEFYIYENSL